MMQSGQQVLYSLISHDKLDKKQRPLITGKGIL